MAYYLVPGLEEISAGTVQKQEGGMKGKRGQFSPILKLIQNRYPLSKIKGVGRYEKGT
jgi:hypothetical protein